LRAEAAGPRPFASFPWQAAQYDLNISSPEIGDFGSPEDVEGFFPCCPWVMPTLPVVNSRTINKATLHVAEWKIMSSASQQGFPF
jgi:hypothetical protein